MCRLIDKLIAGQKRFSECYDEITELLYEKNVSRAIEVILEYECDAMAEIFIGCFSSTSFATEEEIEKLEALLVMNKLVGDE